MRAETPVKSASGCTDSHTVFAAMKAASSSSCVSGSGGPRALPGSDDGSVGAVGGLIGAKRSASGGIVESEPAGVDVVGSSAPAGALPIPPPPEDEEPDVIELPPTVVSPCATEPTDEPDTLGSPVTVTDVSPGVEVIVASEPIGVDEPAVSVTAGGSGAGAVTTETTGSLPSPFDGAVIAAALLGAGLAIVSCAGVGSATADVLVTAVVDAVTGADVIVAVSFVGTGVPEPAGTSVARPTSSYSP